jgi:tripartite-type tricarboxylate transporter receptor subunit TctC
MKRPTFSVLTGVLFACAAAFTATSAGAADPLADFYKDKQMRIVIHNAPGGGYDTYARLLARHITRHIPGSPTIVPTNMPGAGGIKAANYVYSQAPRDGTTLTMISQGLAMYQALELGDAMQADMRKFNWIGNMSNSNHVLVTWHTSNVKTLAEALAKPSIQGATGAGSVSAQFPAVYNSLLGTRFKIIYGYGPASDLDLAMERGEVDGRATRTWASYNATRPDWIEGRKLNYIFQVGLRKEPELQDVPLLLDLAKTEEERVIYRIISSVAAFGRPVATTPDVPKERVAALRAAFDAALKDREFITESTKIKAEIGAMSGAEVDEVVESIVGAPKAMLDRLKIAMELKDAEKWANAKEGAGNE